MKTRSYLFFIVTSLFFSSCKDNEDIKGEEDKVDKIEYYTNPILSPGVHNGMNVQALADPFVLKDDDGTYYMYVTGPGFKVFKSKNLVSWDYMGFTFDGKGWAKANFWGPEVIKQDGKYYMYYVGSETQNSPKRLGMAVSKYPFGPFKDISDQPFYIHSEKQGCIDPNIFRDDDGQLYLYYTIAMSENVFDPVRDRRRSEIFVIKVKSDLTGTIGEPVRLLVPEQSWEYNDYAKNFWNEGSFMIKYNNKYYLMYSANNYGTSDYAVGYATSDSPMGPFVKYKDNPILTSKGLEEYVSGPGHHCVTESPDGTELICVYHSHFDLEKKGEIRIINIDRMGFREDGILYIDGPSYTKQPVPSNKR